MRSVSASLEAAGVQSLGRNLRSFSAPVEWRTMMTGLWVFAGYYLGAKIGFALTFKPHPISVLWPPNSILVAALLLTPPRIWWFLLLAAFPAHWAAQLQSHVPPMMMLCWFVSNSCEALIGAGLTRYLVGGPIRFASLRSMGVFCVCVVLTGPFLSSFLDATFVIWNHWGQGSYWELLRIRFSSNVLAALIVVPLIVTWATDGLPALRTARPSRYLEACVLLLGLVSISLGVLNKFGAETYSAILFLPLPFLLWAAVRFGALGASTAISIVGFLAVWSASHGHGPFSGGTAEQNALSIRIFLIALSIPILFLGAVIEERTAGYVKLRESESRFRIVADAAPVLIWMSGVDKLCTFFNKAWLEFTGRTSQQEMGNGWAEGVHPDDLQKCLQIYSEAFDARQSFRMQYRLRRYDGEYRWITDDGVPRYDAQGSFAGYVGSAIDVTDLLNKDEALRASEERMRLAADAANLGIWEWDLGKDEIWATNARCALLGWPASEKISLEDFISRLHPDDRNRIREMIDRAIHEGKGFDSEYRLVLPDGVVRWMATRGSVHLDADGRAKRVLGISIDITTRKQAEIEAKQRREELSHLSRLALMGEMSASIAHELNQSLAGIASNASAGQRFIDRGNIDLQEIRDLLTDISADARRASDFIREVRGMIRKEQTPRQRVNLNDSVMKAVHLITPDALLHSCELKASLDERLPVVEGDPVQIQQVLVNLIMNALDAMRDVPTSKRKAEITTQQNDGRVLTSVRDYGIGISKETSEKMFEQFFTTKTEGLGMGLAIVRSIVESHGGTIAGGNVEGGGARFYFSLPVSEASSK
jgi:two-component system, LuxR family, sensor kinase FixL